MRYIVGRLDQFVDLLGKVLESALVLAAGLADTVAEVMSGFDFRLWFGGRLGKRCGDGLSGALDLGAGLTWGVTGALDELCTKVSNLESNQGKPSRG